MNSKQLETKRLLIEYFRNEYQFESTDSLPKRRAKSSWEPENKFGFLLGIIEYGQDFLVDELLKLLESNELKQNEPSLIWKMYRFHIAPFKLHHTGNGTSCHESYFEGREPYKEHDEFRIQVEKMDGVCLSCFMPDSNQGAVQAVHIIAHRDNLYDQPSLFEQTGLEDKHQIQNGLFLCLSCGASFDHLGAYLDVFDDQYVLKVVDDEVHASRAHKRKFFRAMHEEVANGVKAGVENPYEKFDAEAICRRLNENCYWNEESDRHAVESNGEMALYFVDNDPTRLPNKEALQFHKIACLIWQMARGEFEQFWYDHDDYPPNGCEEDDCSPKDIQKWLEDVL